MSDKHPFGSVPAQLPAELEARLSSVLSDALEQPRRPWWREAVAFVGVSVLLFAGGAMLFGGGLEVAPEVWRQALALLAASLVVGVAGLAPWPQRTSRPWVLGTVVVGTVVVTQVVSVKLSAFSFSLGCFAMELGCSVVPAGLALVSARHHAPRLSRVMVLGWAAGTMALSVLQLKCPHRDLGHVLLFHVLPLLCVVAATVLARRRFSTASYVP